MNEISVKVVEFGDRKHYQMQFRDPITGRKQTRSTGIERTGLKRDRAEAEKAAGAWEAELREGRYAAPCRISWADFRQRYEDEVLPRLAPRTEEPRMAIMNHVEAILSPQKLSDVTTERLSYLHSKLREKGLKDSTIAGSLAHLRSILAWAKSMGMLRAIPDMQMPTRNLGGKLMRGRPISGEEFDRMISKVEATLLADPTPDRRSVRNPPKRPINAKAKERMAERRKAAAAAAAPIWKRYLNGLWLSGLRLEESLRLTWDADGDFSVDLSGKFPRFRIYAKAEKGHRDRLLPMTPDFAAWLLKTPEGERTGPVFMLGKAGRQMSPGRVGRVVSTIGGKARVKVNVETRKGREAVKYASAHDLRRSFGTRWASKVKPATLQLLMRHSTIDTTLRYYVDQDADDVAAELWGQFGNSSGNTSKTAAVATSDATNQNSASVERSSC